MAEEMTPRERIVRAIEFRGPDRIPVHRAIFPGAFYRHGQKLADLLNPTVHGLRVNARGKMVASPPCRITIGAVRDQVPATRQRTEVTAIGLRQRPRKSAGNESRLDLRVVVE